MLDSSCVEELHPARHGPLLANTRSMIRRSEVMKRIGDAIAVVRAMLERPAPKQIAARRDAIHVRRDRLPLSYY